jgi:polyhydroxyalkanoate synthase
MTLQDSKAAPEGLVSKLGEISQEWASEWTKTVGRSRNAMRVMNGYAPEVGATPADVVLTRNKMRLLRYRPTTEVTHPIPLLFVPSVINRHYILDLQEGKSLVAYLVDHGFDVFIIDWGKPSGEDRYVTYDDIIELYLGAAIRRMRRITGAPKVHLIGHCLGGMLTLTYASLHQEHAATLMNITTPVDLRHGGILRAWTEFMDVDLLVDTLGNVPWPLLQASFHMLKPMMLLQKAAWIYEKLWDDHTVDSFLALETWSNDNVSIAGEFYRTYIKELYQNNALFEGELRVRGKRVDLSTISVPVMNVAAQGDHIAPEESIVALSELVPQTQNVLVAGGHIGGVISRRASRVLWPQLVTFFNESMQE